MCGLGSFTNTVWGSGWFYLFGVVPGWFYLFCVGAWVVLSILCVAWVVLSILCGGLGGFTYSV